MTAKREYVILRDLTPAARVSDPFDSPLGGPRATATEPPQPAVEKIELSPAEVRKIAQEPDVQRIAPAMGTILIKPFEAGTTAATGAWGIGAVGADASSFDGQGSIVAVLDTGIDAGHPAFAGVELVQQDFSGDGIGDQNGHGTHCAGTIFGRDVNGQRIGVARGVTKALVGKVLDNSGAGDSEMIFRAIQWAASEGAHVISMSLGFDFPGSVERLQQQGWPPALATSSVLEAYRGNLRMFDALMEMIEARAAFGEGTVVVAAAGNESRADENPDFKIAASLPAAARNVMSVGALAEGTDGLTVAPFSNIFPQVSAPGVGILSAAVGGGLRALSGTSMACPHVAGVAALWRQALAQGGAVNPSARLIAARLLATARTAELASGIDIADRGAGLVTAP